MHEYAESVSESGVNDEATKQVMLGNNIWWGQL